MLISSPFLVTAHEPQFSLQTFCCTKSSRRHRFVFPGCTLFFYEGDGRSGIDHNSVPKHAVWVENSIVQAVPEHPKKDFVFCLSNSLGDAFLFQVCGSSFAERFRSLIRYLPLLPEYFILFSVEWGWWWRRVLAFAHYRNSKCCDCCSVAQSCPTLCHPMDRSTPGLPVLHYLPEFAHVP